MEKRLKSNKICVCKNLKKKLEFWKNVDILKEKYDFVQSLRTWKLEFSKFTPLCLFILLMTRVSNIFQVEIISAFMRNYTYHSSYSFSFYSYLSFHNLFYSYHFIISSHLLFTHSSRNTFSFPSSLFPFVQLHQTNPSNTQLTSHQKNNNLSQPLAPPKKRKSHPLPFNPNPRRAAQKSPKEEKSPVTKRLEKARAWGALRESLKSF